MVAKEKERLTVETKNFLFHASYSMKEKPPWKCRTTLYHSSPSPLNLLYNVITVDASLLTSFKACVICKRSLFSIWP